MSLQIETQPFQFNSSLTTLDGLTASGAVRIGNNLTVLGNISAGGTATFANTVFTTTSALCAVANSTGPALYIGQQGIGDLASFYDLNPTPVEVLHVGASIGIPGVGIYTSTPNTALTVVGDISATGVLYTANSVNWNTAYASTTALNLSSSSWNNSFTVVQSNSANWNNAYQSVSSQPYTFIASTSSIDTVFGSNNATNNFSSVLGGNCNLASGNYSTLVNGFSSCATGYATFVGAGSGNRATGDYAVVVGGRCNNASGVDSTVGGGCFNRALNKCSTVGGGAQNCAAGDQGTISGGYQNSLTGTWGTIAGGQRHCISGSCSFIGGGTNNTIAAAAAVIAGGRCQTSSGIYSTIAGGLGNYNPLRDSIIGGGVANHTGGYAPFNITAAASISGNGSQTCLIGTGIQSCFSSPFTSNNISVYYATAANPLSAGTFSTATIAATGTNYIIINGDYSTCTASGLSATSIYVYDRAINNTGYDNVIAGGKLNTASGCYSTIGGGRLNCIAGNFSTIGSGSNNKVLSNNSTVGGGGNNTASGSYSTVAGGCGNTAGGFFSNVAGGFGNNATNRGAILGGRGNTNSGYYSSIAGGQGNCICSSTCYNLIGTGHCNVISSNTCFNSIVAGRFNYNPLSFSNIEGGSFNHMGGYAPNNITAAASISGNGTNTALIQTGIGSCFSASSTTGAVSLMWMTSGTAFSNLSSACFTTANVVTNAANCIIINGDYSTCTGTGLSACNIWVFDRCLNQGGCFNFIGGGVLNTASNCYSTIGGGIRNVASCFYTTVGGGFFNAASCNYSTVAGGQCNTASGTYSFVGGGLINNAGPRSGILGGRSNTASAYYSAIVAGNNNCICSTNSNPNNSFIGAGSRNTTQNRWAVIGGGCCNNVSGCWGVIGGGYLNTVSGLYSFVAGGSANDTKGFTNTFILGSNLSASQVNYTYVNNISAQSTISAPSISAVTFYGDGSKLTGITSGGGSGLYLPLSGGTMTGGLSAPSLSANNFYGSGSEAILSDGLSANNTGQGTNTLSLNFSNGVYIGGNGSLSATNIYANGVSRFNYLSADGSATPTGNSIAPYGLTSFTLAANGVYELLYELHFAKTVTGNTVYTVSASNTMTTVSLEAVNTAAAGGGSFGTAVKASALGSSISTLATSAATTNTGTTQNVTIRSLIINGSTNNTVTIAVTNSTGTNPTLTPKAGSYGTLTRIA